MKTGTDYVREAKAALGDPRMSDRELGERLGGYTGPNIARSKKGPMPDTIAIAIAKAIGVHPGEVLAVARAEREKNEEVKEYLLDWAKKGEALVPRETVLAPEIMVMRGGMRAVRRTDEQVWRKR